jgi:prophage antirepressor-like protein
MPDLQNFEFEGQGVRFVGTMENPEWVAVDVAAILDIQNIRQNLTEFDDDEKGVCSIYTLGGEQEFLTVTESGLYRLIFKSRKPVAKRFQKWVFSEVLPSIRKTGSYSVLQSTSGDPALLPVRVRKEKLELIQIGIDIISQLGGLDDRTELQFKDLTRSIVLDDVLQTPALPSGEERLEWPVSDRAVVLGFNPNRGQLMKIGKVVAALYRARYGSEPIKREQFVDGTTRKINMYAHKDLAILDQAIKSIMEQENN